MGWIAYPESESFAETLDNPKKPRQNDSIKQLGLVHEVMTMTTRFIESDQVRIRIRQSGVWLEWFSATIVNATGTTYLAQRTDGFTGFGMLKSEFGIEYEMELAHA